MHRAVRNDVAAPQSREAEVNDVVAIVDELTGGVGAGVVERPPLTRLRAASAVGWAFCTSIHTAERGSYSWTL